jgi:hypothetical protein
MFRRLGNEPGLLREGEEPRKWLGSSPAFDLRDPRLRLKALSLTQQMSGARAKALALHLFVRRLLYQGGPGTSIMTARQTLDAGGGDCFGKASLLVAMLRVCRIPARIRFVQLRGELLRGWLWMPPRHVNHGLVEIWLGGRWIRTDAFVYDRDYFRAARQALAKKGWRIGFGICVDGHEGWDGVHDAFATFVADDPASMPLRDLGVYDDPISFVASGPRPGEPTAVWQHLRWRLISHRISHVTSALRASAVRSSGALVQGVRSS